MRQWGGEAWKNVYGRRGGSRDRGVIAGAVLPFGRRRLQIMLSDSPRGRPRGHPCVQGPPVVTAPVEPSRCSPSRKWSMSP